MYLRHQCINFFGGLSLVLFLWSLAVVNKYLSCICFIKLYKIHGFHLLLQKLPYLFFCSSMVFFAFHSENHNFFPYQFIYQFSILIVHVPHAYTSIGPIWHLNHLFLAVMDSFPILQEASFALVIPVIIYAYFSSSVMTVSGQLKRSLVSDFIPFSWLFSVNKEKTTGFCTLLLQKSSKNIVDLKGEKCRHSTRILLWRKLVHKQQQHINSFLEI